MSDLLKRGENIGETWIIEIHSGFKTEATIKAWSPSTEHVFIVPGGWHWANEINWIERLDGITVVTDPQIPFMTPEEVRRDIAMRILCALLKRDRLPADTHIGEAFKAADAFMLKTLRSPI